MRLISGTLTYGTRSKHRYHREPRLGTFDKKNLSQVSSCASKPCSTLLKQIFLLKSLDSTNR